MDRLHPWHWRKPDMQGFTVTPMTRMQRSWSVGKMLGHKRLGLKKVEASKGPQIVVPG